MSGVKLSQSEQVKTASEKEDSEGREMIFSGWESESRRHIGTLVHQYLEQLARFGPVRWQQQSPAVKQRNLGRQLSSLGVPESGLLSAVADVITAVEKTLASEKGCWILASHPEQACELPLTGMVDGKLVHAIIDRTFVDRGERWIVDYKTSSPAKGESAAAFMTKQQQQYRQQMQTYRRLLQLQDDRLPVHAALYFPLIDGWCELGAGDATD